MSDLTGTGLLDARTARPSRAVGRGDASPPRQPDPPPGAGASKPESERLSELILAYRGGRSDLLVAIFAEVEPIVRTCLAPYGRGRGRARRPLPGALDPDDLLQQSWLILDRLARRWRPDRDFGAYVRAVLPWELTRYVQNQSPEHRARTVRVEAVDDAELLERCRNVVGVDGRDWGRLLVAAEALDELEPLARRVLLRRVLERQSFAQIARALGMSDADALREFRRALRQVRRRVGVGPDRAEHDAVGSAGRALERLVRALHEGAGPERQLPGRSWVCTRTGISEARFARLVRLLVERGCIRDRTARQSGYLVDPSPAETLARVRGS